jgi:hypothetical protein
MAKWGTGWKREKRQNLGIKEGKICGDGHVEIIRVKPGACFSIQVEP